MNNSFHGYSSLVTGLLAATLLLSSAEEPLSPAMSNPAAVKCVKDGFVLQPVMVNGVPLEYNCVDPRTGKACEVWKYYRHECSLPAPGKEEGN